MEEVNCEWSDEEVALTLDTKRKCFGCLSPLAVPSKLENLQKMFSFLNLNYSEIVKKSGGIERLVLDGVVSFFKVKLCYYCGASLEGLCQAEKGLLEVKSNMDKIFADLMAVDRSNTLQAIQIAQLYSKACEDVLIAESKPIKIRRRFCKKVVKALEEEGKLENFIKEKPSSAHGYFVEGFVLNLRLELSEQCKTVLNSEEAQAVPPQPGASSRSPSIGAPAKSASPDPSSSTPRDSRISSHQPGPSSRSPIRAPAMSNSDKSSPVPLSLNSLHSNQQSSYSSPSTSAPTSLQTFEATGINEDTNMLVLHQKISNFPSTSSDSEKRAARLKVTEKMMKVINALKTGQEKLPKLHFTGQKVTTQRKLKKKPVKINPKTGKRKGRKRGSAFKYEEHFNCQGISAFDCKYCSKSYVGEDVRRSARRHYLKKHANPSTEKEDTSVSVTSPPTKGLEFQFIHQCGICDEQFEMQCDADKHYKDMQ